MGQPLHLRGCLLLAAASYGAAPDARARPAVRRVSFSTMATRPAAALQQLHCRHPYNSVRRRQIRTNLASISVRTQRILAPAMVCETLSAGEQR